MRVVAGVLMLAVVHLSRPCIREGTIMICFNFPAYFEPGPSSLLMLLKDVGEINSTVLQSENLASITRLTINDAGVTGIAEKAFSSFSNLRYLSLELNNLSQIHSNWFGEPAALSELILTGNEIEVLNESTFSLLTNLTKLRLNKNMLRIIEQNSFSAQTILSELDLSENKMTWVSPRAFRSLTSTRIRLDGNPWDCSCEAEDFVTFVKDLQSRSLLDKEMHMTCESPPSLRGQLVWNVSACVASPLSVTPPVGPSSTVKVVRTPPPTSNPKTSFKPTDAPTVTSSHSAPSSSLETSVHAEPTYAQTPGPGSTVKVATSSSRPPSKTETSFKPTDAPTVTSSHSAAASSAASSSLETSVHPEPTYAQTPGPASTVKVATSSSRPPSKTETSFKPTDAPTVTSSPSGTHVTSPLDKTAETSILLKFTSSPTTASKPTGVTVPSQPPSDTNIVCVLVAVIAVLCVLLFVVCFLGMQRRRKRNKKTVTPGEDEGQVEEESRSSHESLRSSEIVKAEVAWMRSFTGMRAKSANAVILTSPFCASETLHTEAEAQAKSTEKPAERKQKMMNESEAAAAGGGINTENLTNTADVHKENEKQANAGTNLDETPERVPVSTDTVPYLSIGTDQNKSVPAEESTEGPGQRSKGGKVIKRISTWPPAAALWQQRCKRKAEEDEDGVWTQNVAEKFSDEMKKIVNELGHPFSSDGSKDEDETMKNQMEAHMNPRHSQSLKPTEAEQPKKEGMAMDDPATVTQTTPEKQNANQENLSQNRGLTSAKKPAPNNNKSSKEDQTTDLKRATHSRQRAENRASSSKAPSGGTSPDDETLLSGNEYAFMNLLHEVVQNNGRWTRQRWKQTHANKQRR